jgi:quinol-cytochrome oxidoreductase complex cytochrome b subunit
MERASLSESQKSNLSNWITKRFPVDLETLNHFLSEPVPNHLKAWWFCLGGTPAYLFLVQVVTGILLTFYYVPNPDHAYESVKAITEEVSFGWYIRSLHKWSANLMIVAVILHAMRVFFTGAYRKPRELNWAVGSLILFTVLFFGFTGYSLVYEQLSYWGATVAGNLTESVPFVGPYLARLIRGGGTIGDNTLTRFFIFHIGVLPTVTTVLLFFHFLLIRLHGVSEFQFESESSVSNKPNTYPFYPDHFLTELIIGISLMIVLTCLACIFPAGLGEKANPLVTPEHIKPEWYFYFTFRWLKLTGLKTAVISLGALGMVFVIWPFIDWLFRRKNPTSEASVYVGILGFLVLMVLTLWEVLATR